MQLCRPPDIEEFAFKKTNGSALSINPVGENILFCAFVTYGDVYS